MRVKVGISTANICSFTKLSVHYHNWAMIDVNMLGSYPVYVGCELIIKLLMEIFQFVQK